MESKIKKYINLWKLRKVTQSRWLRLKCHNFTGKSNILNEYLQDFVLSLLFLKLDASNNKSAEKITAFIIITQCT